MGRIVQLPAATSASVDLRERVFESILSQSFQAAISVESAGVISGIHRTQQLATQNGISLSPCVADADHVPAGAIIAKVSGDPMGIVKAEELLLGELSKTSGVATRASQARKQVGRRFRVVCGAFKKMPQAINAPLREAIAHGGLDVRMAPKPFVYLDKNYIRMLGGITRSMQAAFDLTGPVVIQVRGDFAPIAKEAVDAARFGAAILMVDTGDLADVDVVSKALHTENLREHVQLAFAGNLRLTDLAAVALHDVDAVDIGYGMLDAPCLPMRFDVVTTTP